jgi:hypothetical protein
MTKRRQATPKKRRRDVSVDEMMLVVRLHLAATLWPIGRRFVTCGGVAHRRVSSSSKDLTPAAEQLQKVEVGKTSQALC